ITMAAPIISLHGSSLNAGGAIATGGMISLTGTHAVSLSNGTVLNASSGFSPGGTIQIDGGAQFTSQQSRIMAESATDHGGTIQVKASKVGLTDTVLSTSVGFFLEQPLAGSITVEAKNLTLTNSQILNTANPTGQGGTINITSPKFHHDASSVI